ncbi:MAG: RHS repeat-associated core domain-containing protein [Bacteroidales bacterium]|nr:RHS repeat-associated core domain-containing protein [Bacteroidales bacterium]
MKTISNNKVLHLSLTDSQAGTFLFYNHTNHIGSIEKISDKNGNVVDSMSYTPFGQRRLFSDWSKTDTSTHLIDRGFTGQQHLDEFALINFNGRMYDPVLAHFLSPDPYIQSPENPLNYNRYAYCLFSPLQYVDPSGEMIDWVERIINGKKEIYYDRDIKSQEDIDALYGKNSGIKHLPDGSIIEGKYIVYNDHINNRDGLILDMNGNVLNNDRNIISEYNYTIFAGTTDESVDAKTLHKNLFGTSYTGPNNPTDYNGNTTYEYLPSNRSEYGSIIHDLMYDNANVKGLNGALLCTDVWKADAFLTIYNIMNAKNPNTPFLDKMRSTATAIGFGIITSYKMTIHAFKKNKQ